MNLNSLKYIFVVFVTLFFVACRETEAQQETKDALAKVDDRILFLEQFEELIPNDLKGEDSVQYVKDYALQWVKTQLKVIQAEDLLSEQINQINRMVEDYRTSLLNFKIEQNWVSEKLDSMSKDDNIEEYYLKHKSEFVINMPMVKGTIVKMPESYRQKMTLFRLMNSKKETAKQDYIDLCVKNNFDIYEFTSWIDLSDFIAVLPTVKGRNYDYLLKKLNQVQEMADANNKYFIVVSDVLTQGSIAPLQMVSEEITRILYNQHKQNIINDREKELFNQALEEQRIFLP